MDVDRHVAALIDAALARVEARRAADDRPLGDEAAQRGIAQAEIARLFGALETLAALGHLHEDQVAVRLSRFRDELLARGVALHDEVPVTFEVTRAVRAAAIGLKRAAVRDRRREDPERPRLRAVIPVAEVLVDEESELLIVRWAELWSDTTVVGWARSITVNDHLDVLLDPNRTVAERRQAASERAKGLGPGSPLRDWRLQDDVGMTYDLVGGGGGGRQPLRAEAKFRPAVPPAARHLVVALHTDESRPPRVLVDLPSRR